MKTLESVPHTASMLSRVRYTLLRLGTRRFNPLMLSLARSGRVAMFAEIHHQGRRSGRSYITPVAARPTADGFVIPLTFGEQADWFRNLQAAGGCMVRWKGITYPLIEPEIVDYPAVRASFGPAERLFISIVGIKHFVRLRYAPTEEATDGVI